MAAVAKEKGNAAFKAGDYAGAVGHYSAAIVADAHEPTLPLNRAAAYLKLNKNEDAERDCSRALALGGATPNVKALFRRAQARIALQKLSEARQDLHDAQKIEPKNGAVQNELARVASLLEKGKARAQVRMPIEIAAPPLPADIPPKRRRVPIKIVEPTSDMPKPERMIPSATDARITESEPSLAAPSDLLSAVSSRSLRDFTSTSKPFPPVLTDPSPQLVSPTSKLSADGDTKKPTLRAGGGIFRPAGTHTVFPTKVISTVERDATTSATGDSAGSSVPSSAKIDMLPGPAPPGGDVKLPWTLFTFARNWDALSAPEDRWMLLSKVPPASLAALYKSSLEPAHLVSVLQMFRSLLSSSAHELQKEDIKGWVKEYLAGFPRVQRFETIVLFMSTEERNLVKDVLTNADVKEGDAVWSTWL